MQPHGGRLLSQHRTLHARVPGPCFNRAARPGLRHQQQHNTPCTSAASVAANLRSETLLCEWLLNRGGEHRVYLQGRELRAAQDLEAGHVCVRVPEASQLRYDHMEDPRLLRLFNQIPGPEEGTAPAWQFKQALTVLYHLSRGESSPFHIPLHALPGLAPGVPVPCIGMYYTDELLAELQDELLIKSALNHRYWWHTFWKEHLANLSPETDPLCGMQVTLEMFGWAVAVSLSRCFGVKSANAHAMTPLIDMADHSFQSNCDIRNDTDEAHISLLAKKAIPKGTPLTLTYGPHTNAQQLLSYGFVSPENPHNIFNFAFDAKLFTEVINQFGGSPMPTLSSWQLQALERVGLSPSPASGSSASSDHAPPPSASTSTPHPQSMDTSAALAETQGSLSGLVYVRPQGEHFIDARLLAGLRIMFLGEEERYLTQLMPPDAWGRWRSPFSQQNEIRTLRGLMLIITALYKGFPTTIQDDKRLLTGLQELRSLQKPDPAPLPPFQPPSSLTAYELALQYRLCRKQSLERALINVRSRLKELGA